MIEFKADTTIAAPAETVWDILTNTAAWPEWDPFCERIEGTVAPGAKLKAYSKRAAELSPPTRMVWSGGMPLGLFKGVRTFSLSPSGSPAGSPAGDGVRFELHETFDGLMLPLIAKSLPDMTEAFQAFCKGLKERAEAAA